MISSVGTNDIDLLLNSYRSLEERPLRRLETQKSAIDNRISLFSSLKSKLKSLESISKDLSYTSSLSTFGAKSSTIDDESYLTVTTEPSAVVTAHQVTVSQLAKADQIVSNQYSLDDTSLYTTLGTGSQTFSISVNGTTQQVTINIETNDDNETILNKIISGVNNTADIEISASIVKDTETTGRIVFSSNETGSNFEISLSDDSGSLLNTIGMDDSVAMSGTSGGYVYASNELNAIILVDGITIERSSNTIEDSIEGLTISLKKAHQSGDTPLTLNVTNNVEHIKSKIQEFVDAYNDVLSFIKTNTSVDSKNFTRSALNGDFAISRLKMQLRSILSTPVADLTEGSPTILANIGITTSRTGELSISDSKELEDYLSANLDKVSNLFNSNNGFANRITTFLEDYTAGEGIIEKRKDVLQGQINIYNGRISRMEKSVDRKMEYYREQFSQLQAAYAMYSAQFSSLGAIVQSGFIS